MDECRAIGGGSQERNRHQADDYFVGQATDRHRSEFLSGIQREVHERRPAGAEVGDQARIATPKGACEAGADYIVVGRPIIAAPDPLTAARKIRQELGEV